MIIDVHTHLPYHKIFPPAFVDNIAQGLTGEDAKKAAFIKKLVKANLSDETGDELVKLMDDCRVEKSVLLIADFGYAMGEAELSIEEIYDLHYEVIKNHRDRFLLFTGVDQRRGQSGLDLFERSITTGWSKGLKLYPPCGFELDDPELFPFYELCDQYNLPVLSHTGPSFSSLRTERKYPDSILKVSEQFKGVNFILGHGGALNWEANVDVAERRKNVFLEISTYQAYESDSKVLGDRFRYFFDRIPDQIMFGSDWPMFKLGSTLQEIISSADSEMLSEKEREKLFYENAKCLLNL
ncbi:MAG: putative TIM-barrel fold metal-dependent hydrolase [Cyclobacteriaceae bacterium]|jgi:predicted TIM-barrel fold metal-dependent hydrolase